MEEIKGYLITTLFHNEKNKYSVIKIRLDQKKDENVVVVGYFDIPLKDALDKYLIAPSSSFGKTFSYDSTKNCLPYL